MSDQKTLDEKYVIRIYDQDLCSHWKRNTPRKYIPKEELVLNLFSNGLVIHRLTFSNYGACYFIEVSGYYNGTIKYQKLDKEIAQTCFN